MLCVCVCVCDDVTVSVWRLEDNSVECFFYLCEYSGDRTQAIRFVEQALHPKCHVCQPYFLNSMPISLVSPVIPGKTQYLFSGLFQQSATCLWTPDPLTSNSILVCHLDSSRMDFKKCNQSISPCHKVNRCLYAPS